MLKDFNHLLKRVTGYPAKTVAVVKAEDETVLEGVHMAFEQGLAQPILIGRPDAIRSLIAPYPDWAKVSIVAAETPEQAAAQGVALAQAGTAQVVMKGRLHTDTFLRPILAQLRTARRMSHLFVVELKTYPKLLVITDAAMHIAPDLMEKAAIIQNAVDVVRLWGIDAPKVACLSAVETVNPAIPSTIDAACLAKMADRGQIRHAIIDGPLAFDNAISQRSSQIKHIVSPVAGDVDIVLTPDLVSGNILVKDLEYLAGATVAGFIAGAQVPIVLTSRADPPRSRLLSLALALLVHHLSQDGDTAS